MNREWTRHGLGRTHRWLIVTCLLAVVRSAAADDVVTRELASQLSFTVGAGELRWTSGAPADSLIRPGETHFKHLWQLTNGGENAEAYFSWDGRTLVLQTTKRGGGCDQIYTLPATGGDLRLVSTGKGRCTCAYFLPGDKQVLFASTHLAGDECPPPPDHSRGYVWALYPSYDIFLADLDGSNLKQLTDTPGYDAEATVGPDGTIVFTSDRDGDLELYSMRPDGSALTRLTNAVGYDGGAFFSPDGQRICYRAHHPEEPNEQKAYLELLGEGLIRPGKLEIFVMNRDGSNALQLTDTGAANFCPYFTPDGKRIIFASNQGDPRGRNFDLHLVDIESKRIERITSEASFDGFPMFSPDGKRLVFASNRGAEQVGETNIFVAEWSE